jgi:hypothetical protein
MSYLNILKIFEVDATGNIYISEISADDIRLISANKPYTVQIYAGICNNIGLDTSGVYRLQAKLDDPSGVAKDDSSGALYFTDAGNLRKIDASGLVTLLTVPGKESFKGIEISYSQTGYGPIFVTDTGALPSIKSVDTSGNVKPINTSFQLNEPVALAVDSKGNIFVADKSANQIFVIYRDGFSEALPLPTLTAKLAPNGIALDEKDGVVVSIYVSDSGTHAVRTITRYHKYSFINSKMKL